MAVMTYPTVLALGAADHTYVMCRSGAKAWACWGNKSGGKPLRDGRGSTRQADAIAGPDEKAGITCYCINGVCHQAANRILLPANIIVRGARGADLSEIVFGAYGRPRGALGLCRAPFHQHAGLNGDLPECQTVLAPEGGFSVWRRLLDIFGGGTDRTYLRGVLEIYARRWPASREETGLEAAELEAFHMDLFVHKLRYALGPDFDDRLTSRLGQIRLAYERDRIGIETDYGGRQDAAAAFVAKFEERTMRLQADFADVLDDAQYKRLLGLDRHERITLIDPVIAERAFAR